MGIDIKVKKATENFNIHIPSVWYKNPRDCRYIFIPYLKLSIFATLLFIQSVVTDNLDNTVKTFNLYFLAVFTQEINMRAHLK